MKIRKKELTLVSLIYLYLPIVLFLFGWTKIGVFLVTLAAVVYAIRSTLKAMNEEAKSSETKTEEAAVSIDLFVLIPAVLFLLWIGYYAGWGRWVSQASDWPKHNAVLNDLVNRSWPVYYSNGNEHSMLVYYIGQYLVPGFIGKQAGSTRAAEVALYVWSEIGLIMAYFHLVYLIRSNNYFMQFIEAVMLPLFSIPLWISEYILRLVSDFNRVGDGYWFFCNFDILLQYSNNFTLLRWVVPQVVPCWIIMALLLEHRDKVEIHALIVLPGLLFGTLSFLGIIPMAAANAVERAVRSKNLKNGLAKIFSIENLIIMLTLGTVSALYFYGNVFAEKSSAIGFSMIEYDSRLIVYFVFIIVNIVVYSVILWKDNGNDVIFLSAVITLIILPLFKMGAWNDLVMRSSIPGLFILMVYLLRFVSKYMIEGDKDKRDGFLMKASKLIVAVFLVSGMFYSFLELSDVIKDNDSKDLGSGNEWSTLEDYANRELSEGDDVKYNYYAYDAETNIFCKYIARHRY